MGAYNALVSLRMSPLTPAQRATVQALIEERKLIAARYRNSIGSGYDAITAAIAALLAATEPQWQDERRRAAQQATWSRAATVVSYYTGRDLDVMDAEFDAEHCTLPAPPEKGE